MQSLYLVILLFFLFALIFPLGIKIKAHYDVNLNEGGLCVNLWFIQIFATKIAIKGKNIILTVKHNKKKEHEIEIAEPQYRFLIHFQKEVKAKVKIVFLEAETHIGTNTPMNSALVSAFISSVILGLFSKWKINTPTASFRIINHTEFNDIALDATVHFKFTISLFDVIYSFLISILRSRGDRKYERI